MAMQGFDPSIVKSSINNVQKAYDDLTKVICGDVQSQFVTPMGECWACNEAISFFGSFKSSIDSIIDNTDRVCRSIVESMNDAAKNWAATTNTSWGNVSFSQTSKKIDVSPIKENINGVRGVDDGKAADAVSKLTGSIKASADSALESLSNAVSNCGFIGGSQQASLTSAINTIKSNLNSAIVDVSSAANKGITATIENYGKLSQNVSNAFPGQ